MKKLNEALYYTSFSPMFNFDVERLNSAKAQTVIPIEAQSSIKWLWPLCLVHTSKLNAQNRLSQLRMQG